MKKHYTIILIGLTSIISNAQGTWTQKASFGGAGRENAVGFAIGTKGYIGTGDNGSISTCYNDFWEWNQTNNTWTQKAVLPSVARLGAVGFSIGTKGYIGMGYDNALNSLKDFWEWNQATNVWTQKANFTSTQDNSAGFSIGTKGYVGTSNALEFWEWDQALNSWTQKANFPGQTRAGSIGFSIGIKGYLGMGDNNSGLSLSDLWEYNQSTNFWLQKASNSVGRDFGVGFSIGSRGYSGTGHNNTIGNEYTDFYKWDQATNSWTSQASIGGVARQSAVGFSIGNKGYLGTGYDGTNSTALQDLWEFYDTSDTCNGFIMSNFQASSNAVYAGDTVLFTNTSTGALSYTWLVNGTPFSTSANASYIFGTAGSYTVSLTAVNGQCTNTKNLIVTVNLCGSVSSDFSASTDTIIQNNTINFTNTSANATSYNWLINGSQFSTAINSSSTFGSLGTYTITLIAVNSHCKDSSIKNMTVTAIPCPDWYKKANFGGVARFYAVGFSIGTKGYIGTGNDGITTDDQWDFWEWDQATNSWTQKAGYPVQVHAPVGFSIGTKGYVGTGYQDQGAQQTPRQDFYEYDPATNAWTQKADFGGGVRAYATGFSIGTKGYIGTGGDATNLKQDFWEWNQSTNVWTQKANFGGGIREQAVGFSIGTKGYIGTGFDNLPNVKGDFWEWDQATNTWTQKANFGGSARETAVGFSIGNKGYIGTGLVWGFGSTQDFWEWDQATNTWTKKADLIGTARQEAVGFSIGTKGYIGTGWGSAMKDLWEYAPCFVSMSASITSLNPSCFGQCNGTAKAIPASGTAPYAYLWNNGQTTQTATGLCVNVYSVTVTDVTGITTTSTVSLTQPTVLTTSMSVTNASSCIVNDGKIIPTVSGGTPSYSYSWSNGKTTSAITGLAQGTYTLTVIDTKGCTTINTATVTCLTSVEQLSEQTGFIISPNPNNGSFSIETQSNEYELVIFNVFGEKILSQRILNKRSEIDLSKQPDGIYFMQLKSEQRISTRKIIINK